MSDSLQKHPVLAFSPSGSTVIKAHARPAVRSINKHDNEEDVMGKYFLGWLLGIPAVVLVLIYFFMH